MYTSYIKPIIDFLIALIVLCIFAPIMIMIILGLMLYNRGTPFFIQSRPGKNEKVFNLLKFKTMRDAYDENGKPLPDKDRITPVGAWVRKLSLDELPQLINVLKGDMSLVGPRPLLVKYLPLYNDEQKRRHDVKPGITGWAQVNGRNAINWNKKFELDIWYVDNISVVLDVKIFYLTIVKVFKREGVNVDQNNTMIPFNGND
ncbi:MAG: sugar transferase [Cloacibacterium sp.]|uniref:sugar transferase n=1 Tax=Cloacibacterium sp. TaxID=1913682 RepID=UPI003C7219BA